MSTKERGSRMRRKNLYLICAWLAAPLLAAMLYFAGEMGAPIRFAFVLLMIATIFVSTAWFRSLDEVAQRAHYEAWFWGGSAGLMLLPISAAASSFMGVGASDWVAQMLARLTPAPDLADALVAGVFLALAPMTIGYALWWAWFWLRTR